MGERDVRRARAAQVGRYGPTASPFLLGGGGQGLTQEALLERMGSVDPDYAERYSHQLAQQSELA